MLIIIFIINIKFWHYVLLNQYYFLFLFIIKKKYINMYFIIKYTKISRIQNE